MFDYAPLYQQLSNVGLYQWIEVLPKQLQAIWQDNPHGNLARWQSALAQLPQQATDHFIANQAYVTLGQLDELAIPGQQLENALRQFHPWRKGPFSIYGLRLETEWRSDMKWDRISEHINLTGRTVLDVGCGNGYYCWRMIGAGARLVVGIDPTLVFVMQFHALHQLLKSPPPAYVLPLGIEVLPSNLKAFDTVFSMGVLYHQRSPFDHLLQLKSCLCEGGQLILETLVIEGEEGVVLVPEKRYAKMRNVWFIPSVASLVAWLKRCKFHNIQVIDVTTTTIKEQRSTDWMQFESLPDFLDPKDNSRTIEGLPAPKRAVIMAEI